ncbi:MAG: cell division protein FtsH [Candidatus Colwellbacteria bacterium CG10_big_fil_rev_8_21_14_0_10_42_22]|uniref:ATP-dependent zinc metalloprotease FtsH n=1 Tax=Candidatus Colwellbacteria bacterium CG10_big_fil_rev_8_21_14_0_10_42_22 TaxID=1974540 RepID=A0A2H0VI07_9BACT|nr:MAG: cell division protein FtsH [Candidatus Colwellbacteria bacterium CG10_big_fil_rev_8_21_14_0_10_42_22]
MEKNLYKSILRVAVILFSLTLLFSLFYQIPQEPKVLTLSELATKIEAGEVKSLEVAGEEITIVLADGGDEYTSQKEGGVGAVETLTSFGISAEDLKNVDIKIVDQSGFLFVMGVLLPTLLPILIFVLIFWFIFRQAKGGVNQAFTFGRANIHLFTNFKEKITFKDVAGLKEAKQELLEIVSFLKEPKKYLSIGAKIPRGVLLMGPPGTGKTLLARAVAGEAGVPFFHLSASEFVEMFVGVGASRTRDAFNTAKKAAPSILFIDEIDAVGRERGTGLGGGHDEREQTLNQILVEMDGFDRDSKVIVLAATNRPDVLDQALLRPGRFDRRVYLDLPDIREREAILKIHSQKIPLDKDVDFKKIATRTPGFSGADLANLINEAAILAVQEGKKSVGLQNIYDSVEKVTLGPARKSRLVSDKERKITAYHEAGHALVSAGLKHSDPVHKISIVSRGSAGGYTLNLPTEDRHLKTKSQFLADLAVAMGGYVAEGIQFKDISTGASSDLKEASRLARMLVTKFGMSEKLGPVSFDRSDDHVFLGRDMIAGKGYSEEVASKIDNEVELFINNAFKTAKKIVSSNPKALKAIADTLLKQEVLEQDQFEKLIKKFGLKQISA